MYKLINLLSEDFIVEYTANKWALHYESLEAKNNNYE